MDSQTKTQLIQILMYILVPVIMAIIGLVSFLIYVRHKEKKSDPRNMNQKNNNIPEVKNSVNAQNKQSIFNFMEFDNIEDNMIVQRNENRYLMVIGCQGVNYDLMSEMEKNSVEESFVQFLNTLRYPIQMYIQTRAVNLESSLRGYKEKLKEVEDKYNNLEIRYNQMLDSGDYTEEQLQKAYFELTRQANLKEYGNSVIQDTERMSLNRNILNKTYYIVVSYYAAEAGNDKLDKEEIKNIAFSELYTRCQSIISSISPCGVRGKILRTNELVELLYMAYNRDEAETFGLDKALKAGFNELYSTAPDVYEKKMRELDKLIEQRAMDKAVQKVNEARTQIQQQVAEKEENIDSIIDEMAKLILEENEPYIGEDVKDLAIENIEKETKEGGKTDGKKSRGRKKKSTTVQQ